MIGSWQVQVHAVRPYTIHGDLYFELHVTKLDEYTGQGYAVRVPQHAMEAEPQAGQKLALTFLMGQITSAKKVV
jgi:hypothetical protein